PKYSSVAYVSALEGGLTLGFTTWLSQRCQARAGQLAHDKSQREDLYKDFIVAASKAFGDAAVSNEPQIQEFVALDAMISRMRVLSFPRTVACAEKIVSATLDTCFAPNKTMRELHELMKSGAAIDPLMINGASGRTRTCNPLIRSLFKGGSRELQELRTVPFAEEFSHFAP